MFYPSIILQISKIYDIICLTILKGANIMSFWESFGIAIIPAIITAVIGALVSFWCANKQSRSEINKIEAEHQKHLESYKKQLVYDVKKEAILESLTVIDVYLSWLNYDDNSHIPCRESTTPLEITIKARHCFNNLCVTCERERLINLFAEIFFKKRSDVLHYYVEYRNEAREELGINKISFNEEVIFLSKISTNDLGN